MPKEVSSQQFHRINIISFEDKKSADSERLRTYQSKNVNESGKDRIWAKSRRSNYILQMCRGICLQIYRGGQNFEIHFITT